MSDAVLREIRDLIQVDVNHRGLAADPKENLFSGLPDDFADACRSIAEAPNPGLCIVTGFYIAHAEPPAGETDGPLGALFLARALVPLGIPVAVATEEFCREALTAGAEAAGLPDLPIIGVRPDQDVSVVMRWLRTGLRPPDGFPLTHLVALERVGPSRKIGAILQPSRPLPGAAGEAGQEAQPILHDRCYSMRGLDVTAYMSSMHHLFECDCSSFYPGLETIGIGDGGNEIGMGAIPWEVIGRNIPNGGLIACRTPTNSLIVCGVSNWGAYALAAGVALLRGAKLDPALFDVERERELLRIMVEKGPLVDGVTGKPTATVDGLPFDEYVRPLRRIKEICGW